MAKQQSVLPEKIARQKKCPLCGCFFVPDKMARFRCEGCEPVLGGPLNPAVRQLAEDLEKQGTVDAVMEQDLPTRDQVEVMIRKIVKEEVAAMLEEPRETQIDTQTKNSGRTWTFKPKNCIECGEQFVPFVGFQKICDNCKTKAKETN